MHPEDLQVFKQRALQWASQFDTICCLDSNNYQDSYAAYDFLLAAGSHQELESNDSRAFEHLQSFYNLHKSWLFGLFSYDLKDEIEELTTVHHNVLGFPALYFFIPQYLIGIKNGEIFVLLGEQDVLSRINDTPLITGKVSPEKITLEARIDYLTYLSKIVQLKEHISRGDIYEINFCQEFFSANAHVDPFQIYQDLTEISPTPFSGFFKLKDKYILSASPERFLCKRGQRLISQPIKGTAKRSAEESEDRKIKQELRNNGKELAENVMIVDLVRNDLTKSAVPGKVTVDELFGIYSFPQVHQMISTISCQLNPEVHPVQAIKNTFPAGSMTGAPKVRAMELIDELESSHRGIYSGAIGYFDINGDFDFNVVIRSLLYNSSKKYLSFQVGGAITNQSDPQAEYEECMLKASAIRATLSRQNQGL